MDSQTRYVWAQSKDPCVLSRQGLIADTNKVYSWGPCRVQIPVTFQAKFTVTTRSATNPVSVWKRDILCVRDSRVQIHFMYILILFYAANAALHVPDERTGCTHATYGTGRIPRPQVHLWRYIGSEIYFLIYDILS